MWANRDYGQQKRDEYTSKNYHKVSDEIKPDWDLSGAVEDVQMLTWIGYRVAQGDKMPEWKTGTEFKAKRDEAMRSATPTSSGTPMISATPSTSATPMPSATR